MKRSFSRVRPRRLESLFHRSGFMEIGLEILVPRPHIASMSDASPIRRRPVEISRSMRSGSEENFWRRELRATKDRCESQVGASKCLTRRPCCWASRGR